MSDLFISIEGVNENVKPLFNESEMDDDGTDYLVQSGMFPTIGSEARALLIAEGLVDD